MAGKRGVTRRAGHMKKRQKAWTGEKWLNAKRQAEDHQSFIGEEGGVV